MNFFTRYKDIIIKLLVTIGILCVYNLLKLTPLPGIDINVLLNSATDLGKNAGSMFGSSIKECGIPVNIMPYISSTMILQILTSKIGLDYFKDLKKDKELGSKQINQWTKKFTIAIALGYAFYFLHIVGNLNQNGIFAIFINNFLFKILTILLYVSGSLLTIWFANQITKFGVGNGTSMIIFTNIITGSSLSFTKIKNIYYSGIVSNFEILILVLFFFVMISFTIFIEGSIRSIAIRYLGVVGKHDIRTMNFKINNAGVMPTIMASSVVNFPQMILGFLKTMYFFTESINKFIAYFSQGGQFYYIFFGFLLFTFSVTQSVISVNPEDISSNLQETNVVVVGVRPGEMTMNHLHSILTNLNFLAGIYLIFICIVPELVFKSIGSKIGEVIQLSGTSIIILVSISYNITKSLIPYDYKSLLEKYKITNSHYNEIKNLEVKSENEDKKDGN